MEFRQGKIKDIPEIINIINEGKEALKLMGIDQWQDGYPNEETIRQDIENNEAYILEENGEVLAYGMLSFALEKTYEKIYEGEWLSNKEYATIHRTVVKSTGKGRGLSHILLGNMEKICLEKNCHSIKVDTHRDNKIMQNTLLKNSYKYCGIIYLEDGSERLAYEKFFIKSDNCEVETE